MAENFQDNVSYGGSTLAVSGDAIAVGSTNAGAKSIIFNNSGTQGHLAWQPTANRTINLPDISGTIQLIGQVPGAFAAGTQTAASGTISFVNSNGISFGMSGSSQITASYTVPSIAGLISVINFSAGTTSNNLTNFVFSNSNNISFGLNGSTITATVTVPAQTSLSYSNLNGLTFGIVGSTLTGSYTVPTQSNQTEGRYALGNTTGQSSSSTFDARTMSFSGAGNISVGYSGNALVISGAGGGAGSVNISAGTTSNNLTNFVFSNSNGLAFGLNGSTITGSYTVPTQTAYQFSNSNGISFGTAGSTITASYTIPTQTAQTVGLYGLGNTTQNSSTTLDARSLSFNGLGIVTVGYSNGSIQISATQSNQTQGRFAIGNTTGQSSSSTFDARTISFSGAGNISVGYSGNALIISGAGGGNINISGGTTSNNLTNFVFSNSNGVSFGLSGSTITASAAGGAGSVNISAGTTSNDLTNFVFSNSNGISFGISGSTITATISSASLGFSNSNNVAFGASGSTTITASAFINLSAGTTNNNASNFIFSNANNVSFGITGSTITASVAPGGGGSINISAGTTSNNLTNFVFSNSNGISFGLNGSTITASGGGGGVAVFAGTNSTSTGTVVFSNSNGMTFGMDTNGVVTASYTNPAVAGSDVVFSNANGVTFGKVGSTVTASIGGGLTLSYFNPQDAYLQITGAKGNASLHIQPAQFPNVTYDRIVFPLFVSNAVNSTGTVTLSMQMGLYTRNGSTLSLSTSYSTSNSLIFSGSANSSNNIGIKLFTLGGLSGFVSEGQYWVGILSRSSTGGANMTLSQIVASQANTNLSGFWGQANNASIQYTRGLGIYNTGTNTTSGITTSGIPSSIGFSQIFGTAANVLQQPIFYVVNGTI